MQNDVSLGGPVRFSIAEVNLALVGFVFAVQSMGKPQRFGFGPVFAPIVIYLCICLLSSISDFRGQSTLVSFLQMTIYLIVDVIVFTRFASKISDYRLALTALIFVCVFLAMFALVNRSNYILGLNKNGLGGSLSFGTIIAAELWFASKDARTSRLLLFATGIISMGLIMTLSRGSWLGTIGGLLTVALLRRRFKFMFWAAAALVPFIALCWHFLPDESKDFATGFETKRENIRLRLVSIDFAADQFQKNPIIGQGVGLRKEFDATNIIMMILAETGILGLLGFIAIHISAFKMILTARTRLDPSSFNYSILIICGALLVAKFGHGLVDHYWSRGDLMLTWAAVGMATRVYLVSLQRPASNVVMRGTRRPQIARPDSSPDPVGSRVPFPSSS